MSAFGHRMSSFWNTNQKCIIFVKGHTSAIGRRILFWNIKPEAHSFSLLSTSSPPSSGEGSVLCSSAVTSTTGPSIPEGAERVSSRTGTRDGVARSGAASQPQTGSRQELRGGEEESADGVQVGSSVMRWWTKPLLPPMLWWHLSRG